MAETGTVEKTIGTLTFEQFRDVIAMGLPVAQAKELAQEGFGYEALKDLAAAAKPQGGGLTDAQLTKILDGQRKAMRPENEQHPGKSAYSYPDGDLKHPKAALPYQLFWNNYPVHKFPETEGWADWELYGQLKPGTFTILRKDLSKMTVTIAGERNADGKVEKLSVVFPVRHAEKWLVPPLYVLLYQLAKYTDPTQVRKVFLEAMQQYIQMTLGGEAA